MENVNGRIYGGTVSNEALQTTIDSIPEADKSHPGENSDRVVNMREAMDSKTSSHVVPVEDHSGENKSEENLPEKAIENPDNPLDPNSERKLGQLLKQVGEMVQIMEASWTSSKQEFQLTDTHMKFLYQFNEEHREEMPEYLTKEQKDEWDHFNGLNHLTEDDVIRIFGDGHPIIGVAHTQTMDRIKDVTIEFFQWMTTLREYREINDAYMQLLELREEQNIQQLQDRVDAEEDPEKKTILQNALDTYNNRKYLDFLAEPQDPKNIERLVKAFSDKNKIHYWLNRSQDKLKQLKIGSKIILEISQFEKRFLPEQYHKLSNILLLHFMQTIIYCSCSDKNDVNRNKAVCMTMAFDKVIRHTEESTSRTRVMNNIMKFLDQFMDKINAPVDQTSTESLQNDIEAAEDNRVSEMKANVEQRESDKDCKREDNIVYPKF